MDDCIGYHNRYGAWMPAGAAEATWLVEKAEEDPDSVLFCTTAEEARRRLELRYPADAEGYTHVVGHYYAGRFSIVTEDVFAGSLEEASKIAISNKRKGVVTFLPEYGILPKHMQKDFRFVSANSEKGIAKLRYERDWKARAEARQAKRRSKIPMMSTEFADVACEAIPYLNVHSVWKLGPGSREMDTCMNAFLFAMQQIQADYGENAHWGLETFRKFIAEWKRRYEVNQGLYHYNKRLVGWLNEQCSFEKWPRRRKLDKANARMLGSKPKTKSTKQEDLCQTI